MKRQLEEKLFTTFPDIFKVEGPNRMYLRYVEHGDGWFNLLFKLCENIQTELDGWDAKDREEFHVLQVKEKFGGLRFYVSHSNDVINNLIDEAEGESFKTCEECGGEAKRGNLGHWICTLCEPCKEKIVAQREKEDTFNALGSILYSCIELGDETKHYKVSSILYAAETLCKALGVDYKELLQKKKEAYQSLLDAREKSDTWDDK